MKIDFFFSSNRSMYMVSATNAGQSTTYRQHFKVTYLQYK